MTQTAMALVQNKCDKCAKDVEPDGFCSWHGQYFDMWMCDDCVHEFRSRGANLPIPERPAPALDQIEHTLVVLDAAIRNLGMIDMIIGQDGAKSNRDVNLYLNFRESKQVYRLLTDILRSKLDAAKDVAAQNARDLLKRLNK